MTPTSTRALLRELGLRPKKRLGQNFLVDGNIVRKSISMAGIQPGDLIVEIGPGLGALTSALLEAGALVHAIETDPVLVTHLGNTLVREYPGNFRLTRGDAAKQPLAGLSNNSPRDIKIVANLPYAISTPWIDAVLTSPALPARLVLMLQKEAADRFTAAHGSKSFGAISIFLQSAFELRAAHRVSRNCFYPAPDIGSALIHLDRREDPITFPSEIRTQIRAIFSQRRKQIGAICRNDPALAGWIDRLGKQSVPLTLRPEAIPVEVWQEIARDG